MSVIAAPKTGAASPRWTSGRRPGSRPRPCPGSLDPPSAHLDGRGRQLNRSARQTADSRSYWREYGCPMAPSQSGDAPDVSAGFTSVDRQPDTDFLVATMDATARWPAVRYLRSWERSHLALQPGERIVDVGCGPGDVTIGLCADVGAAGHVPGVDASTAMLDVARRRAAEAGANAEFGVGDAQALALPD